MKLLNLSTRYYFWTFLIVSIISALALYSLINYFVYQRLDKSLLKEQVVVNREMLRSHSMPEFLAFAENELEIQALADQDTNTVYSNIELYSTRDEEVIPYRQLTYLLKTGYGNYKVNIRKSLLNTRELVLSIAVGSILTVMLFLTSLVLVNRRITRRLWLPFYDTLDKLKAYQLESGNPISFQPERIQEFNELNQELNALMKRIMVDYHSQLHFVENASHELQTPLAVIKSKLELILQSEALGQEELKAVSDALHASNRISRLNRSLILLSKIENLQYSEVSVQHIDQTILSLLQEFEQNILVKHLIVEKDFKEPCRVRMNQDLCEVMITNILKNAIRHNITGGKIIIKTAPKKLVIMNTGEPYEHPNNKVFERFYKRSQSKDSLGLGLAIVKQICLINHFKISYQLKAGWHTFEIFF